MQELHQLETQRQQLQQQRDQLEAFARRFLTPEALSRYGNLKAVHAEKALQSLVLIAELVSEGKLRDQISDDAYKNILLHMEQRKENTIRLVKK